MSMEFKRLQFEVKAESNGAIEGYGSVFGNVDLGGDVVERGAFADGISAGKRPKMLYQHRPDMPIGVWDDLAEDERGLRLRGRLALNTQMGREVHELARMGALDGLSIGFMTEADEIREGKRVITKADLWEVSLVTFPMNTEARIDAVKAAEMGRPEFERLLTHNAGLSRSVARALMRDGLKGVAATHDAGSDGLGELAAFMRSQLQSGV